MLDKLEALLAVDDHVAGHVADHRTRIDAVERGAHIVRIVAEHVLRLERAIKMGLAVEIRTIGELDGPVVVGARTMIHPVALLPTKGRDVDGLIVHDRGGDLTFGDGLVMDLHRVAPAGGLHVVIEAKGVADLVQNKELELLLNEPGRFRLAQALGARGGHAEHEVLVHLAADEAGLVLGL